MSSENANEDTEDDGIVNFLCDAIGGADTELQDIGDSNTFAELLDVVTASLNADDTLVDNPQQSSNEKNKTKAAKQTTSSSPRKKSSKSESKNKSLVSPPSLLVEKSSTSDKIKNRLKIRLKVGPSDNSSKNTSSKSHKHNTATNKSVKQQRSPVKVNKIVPTPSTSKKEEASQKSSFSKKRGANVKLHKKCNRNLNRIQNGCEPCCVIMYDILKTDKFFEMVTPSVNPKSSGTSINLCSVSEDNIDAFHGIEKKNRAFYQKLFNPTKTVPTKIIEVEREDKRKQRQHQKELKKVKQPKDDDQQKPSCSKGEVVNLAKVAMSVEKISSKERPTIIEKNEMVLNSEQEEMMKNENQNNKDPVEVDKCDNTEESENVIKVVSVMKNDEDVLVLENRKESEPEDLKVEENISKAFVNSESDSTENKIQQTKTEIIEPPIVTLTVDAKEKSKIEIIEPPTVTLTVDKKEKYKIEIIEPPTVTLTVDAKEKSKIEIIEPPTVTLTVDEKEKSKIEIIEPPTVTLTVDAKEKSKIEIIEPPTVTLTVDEKEKSKIEIIEPPTVTLTVDKKEKYKIEIIEPPTVTLTVDEKEKSKIEIIEPPTVTLTVDEKEKSKIEIIEPPTVTLTVDKKEKSKTEAGSSVKVLDPDEPQSLKRSHQDTPIMDEDDQSRKAKRRREKDESKRENDKMFERLEHERQRKSSDNKKISKTTDNNRMISTSFSPTPVKSGLTVSQSFRIPRDSSNISKPQKLAEPSSTPLAKMIEDEPSEFNKFNRTKERDKDDPNTNKPRHAEVTDPQKSRPTNPDNKRKEEHHQQEPKQTHTMPHTHNNKELDTRHLLVKPVKDDDHQKVQVDTTAAAAEVKKETQPPPPVNVDEAYDSSIPSEGDRTIPPVTELKIGNFARAVTKLAQTHSDVEEVLTFEEGFSRKCDATTEKCAWWFANCDKEPPDLDETRLPRLESATSLCGSDDDGSEASFLGNVSDSEIRDNETCQVYEISSTSHKYDRASSSSSKVVRDPDKVDEYCGRSLLQAKIRTASGQNFRNLFDLRAGALYEKENFQAKCNLCNQLIVGKKDLATHVRGTTHKDNLRKLDSHMEKTGSSTNSKEMSVRKDKKKENNENESKSTTTKPTASRGDSKDKEVNKKENDDKKTKTTKIEYGTTSNGLSVKIPVPVDNDRKVQQQRSTKSPEPLFGGSNYSRSGSGRNNFETRSKSRSPTRVRRRRSRSRSPVRIPRSPTALRKARRSRSRSPSDRYGKSRRSTRRSRSRSKSPRPSRRRRSSSEEYRKRRRSPEKSRKGKRSKSRSPPIVKKDNREFHAKLGLTADGKWTDEMEKQWKLMEAEEAMFREQFLDRRKEYVTAPEEHPRYATEWTEFWERRYQEVEKEGKDPDTYNYVLEWKDFWAKRLNFLLQEEADEKIREIKKKYKMDFDSLNSLQKNVQQHSSNSHPERVFFERQNVPPPPLPVPPVNPIIDIRVDSQSSNGHGSVIEIDAASGISISSGLKGSEPKTVPDRKPSISIEDFKSTWDALTRPKVDEHSNLSNNKTANVTPQDSSVFIPEFSVATPYSQPINRAASTTMSDITSSSSGSFDFLGFDLVQVLRLMCKTEDQLSFLAPKVLEYYKIAEELELKKSKGSLELLNNEELVTVLFQARDRFMTMIRSNVLGREILQTLNLTVYGLNAILDAPQCQKYRPKLPPAFSETYTSKTTTVKPEPVLPIIEPLSVSPLKTEDKIIGCSSLVAHLSSEAKSVLAGEISKYLLLMGGQTMSNLELSQFVIKLVTPLVKKTTTTTTTTTESSDAISDDLGVGNISTNSDLTNSAFDLGHDYTHSFDMRITGVSGSKAVGSAIPHLSSFNRSNVTVNPSNTTSGDRRPPPNDDDDGRQSPFSRRELPMNPDRGRFHNQ